MAQTLKLPPSNSKAVVLLLRHDCQPVCFCKRRIFPKQSNATVQTDKNRQGSANLKNWKTFLQPLRYFANIPVGISFFCFSFIFPAFRSICVDSTPIFLGVGWHSSKLRILNLTVVPTERTKRSIRFYFLLFQTHKFRK